MHRLLARAWANPWLLLFLCSLFWGSNVVVARLASAELTPVTMASVRWLLASIVIVPMMAPAIARESGLILKHWKALFGLGITGFSLYSLLFYGAGATTTGVNMSMLTATAPIFALAFGALFLGIAAGPMLVLAVILTLLGAMMIATRGDIAVLRTLTFNLGDLLILSASILHGIYTVALRNRPPLSPLVFFAALAVVGAITSLPPFLWEVATGRVGWPSLNGWGLIVYATIFPTILSQVFYTRGVELIGPQRVAMFYNITPLLGSLLAVLLLGEPFGPHHFVAMLLVGAGIGLAEYWRARTAARAKAATNASKQASPQARR